MKKIMISDVTLPMQCQTLKKALSFWEKLSMATGLEKAGVDAVELPALQGGKEDVVVNRTIASTVKCQVSMPVGGCVETLNEAWRAGKIRVFGVSNWTHERIDEANAYAAAHGLQGFTVSSPNYGLADQVCDPWGGGCVTVSGPNNAAARAWYAANQMPLIAYSSLGRGFFSGKFRSDDPDAAKAILDPPSQKGYLCPENLERLHRAEQLAAEKQCTVSQIAMRYIFSSPMNVFAVVSTQNLGRMQENIAAALQPLTDAEAAWVDCRD